ncbi:MAG: universal stress protein [Alphaproteobacteria bacterium]|nr:universal stress protein [Emcibacter sp.]NOZ67593.1 universal stress protein [Alphaproteobacteria bacterium]HEC01283.1 universal stress protein [Sphingomonadales bacterium]
MANLVYLVGVDGSEWSDRAAERAIALAQKTGAEVHFITAVQWSKYQPLYVADFSPPPQDTSEQEKWERKEVLEPLEERYGESGVPIKTSLFWGHPADIIKEQAKKIPANMIFVGRKGRSKVASIFLGSVANSLAHTAGVPIVLVP